MRLPRRYRILLMTVAGLFVLWVIYYAATSVIYGAKLRKLKARVEAEGSLLDLAKLASRYAPQQLDPSQNAAFLYRAAGALMEMRAGANMPEAESHEAFIMARPEERAKLVSEKRESLETWLRDRAVPLQLLHEAAHHEHAWFDVDYAHLDEMQLDHLMQLRTGARLLMLEAWLAADQGDAHKALQAVWTAFRIRRAAEDEPLIINQLVGVATDAIAAGTLEDILPHLQPSADDLRSILTELQSRNPKAFRCSAEGERALIAGHMESARKNGIRYIFRNEVGGIECPTILEAAVARIMNGILLDETFSLSFLNRYVGLASNLDSLSGADLQRLENEHEQEMRRIMGSFGWRYFHPLSWRIIPALLHYLSEAKRDEVRRDLTQCGIAAELYRLDHGTYPASLDALVPKYIAAVPQDTFSERPLLFKSLPDGVLIYSVGPDGRDDGGVEEKEHRGEPDYVWRVERVAAKKKP